jgi:hypothetical protein
LRARWYNPQNGLFNRIDPFSGNTHDPQSLHKYLYCHANPINAIDPSGDTISTQEVSVTTLTGAEIYALSLAANLLIARTVVQELTSPSVIAESLRVPIIPLPKVEPKTSDKGYVYFVHGTHTFDWLFRHEVRGDIGGQQRDFGRGFYTFKLSDPGSLKAASQFAEMVSASRGLGFSSPILIIVRFHRATYNNLNKKDLKSNPIEWERWVNDFWNYKRFAPTGYDEIYGPESGGSKRSFTPILEGPIQHKFEQSGISKGMEVVGVVPVPNRFLLAGQ